MASNDIMWPFSLGHPHFVSHQVFQQLAVGSWIGGLLPSLAHTIYIFHFPIYKAKEINLLICEVQVLLKFSYENPNMYEIVSLVPGIIITVHPAYCHSDIPLCTYLSYCPTHEVSEREMQDFGHLSVVVF